jgi:glycosyltransferase involved in cell wall biosynthesis
MFSKISREESAINVLTKHAKECFGENYTNNECKNLEFKLVKYDKMGPWYNQRGTEFLMIDDGNATINGMPAAKGDIIRIDVGDITLVETQTGCSITSHIFRYRKNLVHLDFVDYNTNYLSGPLVSIIIIGKDIENYIGHSISSCLQQTYKDLQIIVIDDASNDSTLSKALNMASFDKRVEVYSQALGVNGARKYGLERARGEYFLIIDGDDWINKDTIEKLISIAQQNNSECIGFGFDHYNDLNGHTWHFVYPSYTELKKTKMYDEKNNQTATEVSELNHTIWMYFLSKKMKDPAINALIDIPLYEDIPYYISIIKSSKNPMLCNCILYHYRRARVGQATGNWDTLNAGIKRMYLELSIKHTLSSLEKDDWFEQLILLYKIKRIVDHEISLPTSENDSVTIRGWEKTWKVLARTFPLSLAKRIQDKKTHQSFILAIESNEELLKLNSRSNVRFIEESMSEL